jgi:putative SOS response-associated peptidase YedK
VERAPTQELLVRENHTTGERSLDLLKWGLIPYWCKDASGGRKPINAKSETVVAKREPGVWWAGGTQHSDGSPERG